MIIVGERLNSSRRPVLQALQNMDERYILEEAVRQEKAGADFIDLNAAALLDREIETLRWAIPLLQKELKAPLSIDTPNPDATREGLKLHEGKALLNSLSGEKKRIDSFLPLIREFKPWVVVLCLDDEGLPKSPEEELSVARRMVDLLDREGIPPQDIFLDPLVRPVGVDHNAGKLFLGALETIKKNLPDVKTIAGISNVSFGLPRRKLLNRDFLLLALQSGLDAAILDPLDKEILAAVASAQALLGKDPSLKHYLSFIRKTPK